MLFVVIIIKKYSTYFRDNAAVVYSLMEQMLLVRILVFNRCKCTFLITNTSFAVAL